MDRFFGWIIYLLLFLESCPIKGNPPWSFDMPLLATGNRQLTMEIPSSTTFSISGYYPFQLKELALRVAEISFPVSQTWYSFQLAQAGDEVSRESMLVLKAGKALNQDLFFQAELACYQLSNLIEAKRTCLFPNLLFRFQPAPPFKLACFLFNPLGLKGSPPIETAWLLPAWHLGILYQPVQAVHYYLEFEKMLGNSPRYHMGLTYTLHNQFQFLTGLQAVPLEPSFGLSYRTAAFSYTVAGNWHQVLGLSSGFSVSYRLADK